jgi:hypothetical protein
VRAFVAEFRGVAEALGARLLTPTAVIEGWLGFVVECEGGYADNIYEFDNDLSVRRTIEKLLGDQRLSDFEQMGWVRDEIAAVDERYRALLGEVEVRPGRPWWEARVPRLAGAELAEDFETTYGVRVAVVP